MYLKQSNNHRKYPIKIYKELLDFVIRKFSVLSVHKYYFIKTETITGN